MDLERYRDLIPDWQAFLECIGSEEPSCLRLRNRKAPGDLVKQHLEELGFEFSPVVGLPDFLKLERGPYSLSKTLAHWLGWFYIQESVMGLPALALDPQPGDRVLDLCAAPGGKTSHLADLMGGSGTIVAVEPSRDRLKKLVGNLYRLGLPEVLAVAADGRTFPGGATFDRVMVDAPCSAQGTLRRKGGKLPLRPPEFVAYISGVQEALLRRAAAMVRPGGTIVYATCTFDPSENEAVVSRVLEDLPLDVEPIDLPLPHEPGVTKFENLKFDPRLERAWRVYPYHLDSGGLFMVRLRRTGERLQSCSGWRPTDSEEPRSWSRLAAEALTKRFGVAENLLRTFRWWSRGKTLWAHRCDALPLDSWRRDFGWQLVSLGLPAFRVTGIQRPTNVFLRFLGPAVQAARADLDRDQLLALLRGEGLDTRLSDGDTALALNGWVVGRGRASGGRLEPQLDKKSAAELRTILSLLSNLPAT
jgi:NOL1/NOP2/sun family putative RNA methylase